MLLGTGKVFNCWGHIHETIIESEIGASKSIMDAGYTIDSLMLRYQVRGGNRWCASAGSRQPAAAARARRFRLQMGQPWSRRLLPQGVDWRDPSITRQACNGELNPLQPGFNDGINVEPLEVMFIKVRRARSFALRDGRVAAA